MMERLLERISKSKYRKNFILKGGMLVANLIGINARSTVDIDSTITGLLVTIDSLRDIFNEVISIDTGDDIKMEIKKIYEIRHDSNYTGIRISLDATYDKSRIPIKFDITTGDKITPEAIEYSYNLLLENRSLKLLTYNIETVIAEKFETIISRGVINTRMRDFYDLYILYKLKNDEIDYKILKNAINATVKQRYSMKILEEKNEVLREIFDDYIMRERWGRYSKKFVYASNIMWEEIEKAILDMNKMIK